MTDSTRIVHLAKYLPSYAGGMEAVTHELAQAAVAMGASVAIVGVDPGKTPHSSYGMESEGVEQIPVRSYGDFGPVPLAPGFFQLARYLRKTDIVHVHLPNPLAELALLKHLWTTPKSEWPRIVPIAHVAIVRWPSFGKLWAWAVQRPLLKRSEWFIASSRQLVEAVPVFRQFEGKAVIMPFPTAAANVKAPPKSDDASSTNTVVQILAIGRLVPYKGFDVLIRALAKIGKPWRLTIVGQGPQAKALQRLAISEKVADQVQFVGRASEAEKQKLLASCDLFVAPSTTSAEAYGIVIAEAFAYGKAVVTTSLPTGVAYLARGGACGAVSAPGDANSLREALLPLLADADLRRRCGSDNLRFWQRELTRSKFMERYQTAMGQVTLTEERRAG